MKHGKTHLYEWFFHQPLCKSRWLSSHATFLPLSSQQVTDVPAIFSSMSHRYTAAARRSMHIDSIKPLTCMIRTTSPRVTAAAYMNDRSTIKILLEMTTDFTVRPSPLMDPHERVTVTQTSTRKQCLSDGSLLFAAPLLPPSPSVRCESVKIKSFANTLFTKRTTSTRSKSHFPTLLSPSTGTLQ